MGEKQVSRVFYYFERESRHAGIQLSIREVQDATGRERMASEIEETGGTPVGLSDSVVMETFFLFGYCIALCALAIVGELTVAEIGRIVR